MSKNLSRRDFMVRTAALMAAPMIVPRYVLGGRKFKSPSEKINIGFIGIGYQARGHLRFCVAHPDCKVVAVCDVDTTRRLDSKKIVDDWYSADTTYKGCDAYENFRELIARKDIDAVFIGTPDHWHVIPAVEAMKSGKDVYCEKPLTLTIAEAKVMVDVARKNKAILQTGSQQRSDREFRIACEAVQNGRIGKVIQVYASVGGPSRPCDLPEEAMEPGLNWDLWLGQAPKRPYNSTLSPRGVHNHFPDWRAYREFSGGGMTDWGAHHFDIAQWGLGMDTSGPVEITPPADPKSGNGVRYLYANGVELIHGDYTDKEGKGHGGVNFVGENGVIHVNRGELESWPPNIVKDPLSGTEKALMKSPGHQQNFFDCVRDRKLPICDVEIGARSVTVCHLGNLAYQHGRKLKWDPKAWHFVNDKEADKWMDRERTAPWKLPKA